MGKPQLRRVDIETATDVLLTLAEVVKDKNQREEIETVRDYLLCLLDGTLKLTVFKEA